MEKLATTTNKRIMRREPSLLILLLLVSYPAVGAVLFTPALPMIAHDFNVKTALAQLTVTLFLIGYAIGQLPYGPLSNVIGRKPTLYIGLILSILGSLLCALTGLFPIFSLLVFGRILAALGASVGLMMTFTILSDYYKPDQARKKLSFVILAFAIAPNAAVAIGGYLTQLFGWESTFYFISLYGLALLILSIRLPETSTELSGESFNLKLIIESYVKRCNNFKLVLCGIIQGCCTAFAYIFAALAPFLAIHELQLSPSFYGILNIVSAVGMIFGSLLSYATHRRLSPHRSILLGLLILAPATIVMWILFAKTKLSVYSLFGPYFFVNVGIPLVYINCPVIGTGNAKNKPNASAVLAFLNIGMCVVTVLALQIINLQTPLIMPIFFAALLIASFSFYYILERRIASDM